MSSPGSTQPARPHLAQLISGLIFLYPALVGWLASSEQPQILGRWSRVFFGYNLWATGVLVLLAVAWVTRRHGMVAVAQILLVLTTILLPANNQLRELAGIAVLMPAIRLACGVALLMGGFEAHRRGRRGGPPLAAVGCILCLLSLVDFVLLAVLAVAPQERQEDPGMRVEYATDEITATDVIIVGDSFVWGQGVEPEQRFGDRLEGRLRQSGLNAQVYSLGLLGAGPVQYLEMLNDLPRSVRVDRVVVAFYMNDMPEPQSLQVRIKGITGSFGLGFPSLRFVGDRIARVLTADVDEYHEWIVDCYREDDSSYEARWSLLESQMAALAEQAISRSVRRPILMILPIMVGFDGYPLDEAHRRVAELGESLGFEMLDLLPRIRDDIGEAEPFRVSPDDNHFNAQVHDLVARALLDRLVAVESAPSGLP